MKKTSLRISLAITLLIGLTANASVVFSQDGDNITLAVTDQSYTLTSDVGTGQWFSVGFLDVFASGGSDARNESRVAGTLTYSINGGASTAATWWTGWQYRPGTEDDLTAEDAGLLIDSMALSTGDTIVFNGSLTMDSSLDSDIIMPTEIIGGTVNTALFNSGNYVTAITSTSAAVPEPATAGMLAISGLLIAAYRRFFGRV